MPNNKRKLSELYSSISPKKLLQIISEGSISELKEANFSYDSEANKHDETYFLSQILW